MCQFADSIELEFIKDKISFDAYVKADKFVQNIQDCRDGNSLILN